VQSGLALYCEAASAAAAAEGFRIGIGLFVLLTTPVVFLIFNRPDLTARVFRAIAEVRPARLLIVADGPRFPEEAVACARARSVVDRIDWQCEVKTNYTEQNMGCNQRVSTGLDWAFSQVEEAIILEDDCLPDLTFFRYCQEVLTLYRNEPRVMHIAGTNLVPRSRAQHSFLFSRLVPIWGWATWRRAWKHYDIDMKLWPQYIKSEDLEYFGSARDNVHRSFDKLYNNEVDAWGGRWAFACVVQNGLSVLPKTNLVRNLGFRPDATHTVSAHWSSSVPVKGLRFPLKVPWDMSPDRAFDEYHLRLQSGSVPYVPSFPRRVRDSALRRLNCLLGRQ
jgi:hypothetical protein